MAGASSTTIELFSASIDDLRRRAAEVSADARERLAAAGRQTTMQAAPIILTGNCMARPVCRHCKWRHFKAVKRDPFILDISTDDAIARAHALMGQGVRRAFAATGWMGYSLPGRFVEKVAAIREAEPQLELYGLFGALDRQSHLDLAAAGLTGMLTGLESASEAVYRRFRPGGDSLGDRIRSFDYAREAGLRLWTGFLVGLGESVEDCARGIDLIASFEPQSVSILPFEPFPDTEMEHDPPCDPAWLERVNAVARIRMPGVPYFFSDSGSADGGAYAERLGLNAVYAVGRRAPGPATPASPVDCACEPAEQAGPAVLAVPPSQRSR